MALVSKNTGTKEQLWYIPSPSQSDEKVINLLEKGRKHFRQNFINETMDLTVKEFLEIIYVFDSIKLFSIKDDSYK